MTLNVVFPNNPLSEFYAGQRMSGFVRLDTGQPMTIRGISAQFYGEAQCRWTDFYVTFSSTITTRHTYFNSTDILFGESSNSRNKKELPAGRHDFPFEFTLPADVPHTFKGRHGHVRYYVGVTIDKPWFCNTTLKHAFTIAPHLDLNRQPDAMMVTGHSAEKSLCGLWCKSGSISANVFVQRKGYVAGDVIRFCGEISNFSSRDCDISIYLMRRVTFHNHRERKKTEEKLGVNVQPPLKAGQSALLSGKKVLIPADCGIPSFLKGCAIIEVHYFATVQMAPSGPARSLRAEVEVIIGTVPHRRADAADFYAHTGLTLPGVSQSDLSQPGVSDTIPLVNA